MRWPWRQARLVEPRPMVSRAMKLQVSDPEVEEMIQRKAGGKRAGGTRRAVAGDILCGGVGNNAGEEIPDQEDGFERGIDQVAEGKIGVLIMEDQILRANQADMALMPDRSYVGRTYEVLSRKCKVLNTLRFYFWLKVGDKNV